MPSEEKINRFKGLRSTNAEHLLEENQLSDMNNMRTETGALVKRKGFGDTKLMLHIDGRYYWPFVLDPWRPPWGEDPEEPGGPVVWRRPPEDPENPGEPPDPWPPGDPDGPYDPPVIDTWEKEEDPDNPNGADETYVIAIPAAIVAYTPFLQTVTSSDVAYAGADATHTDQIYNEDDRQLGHEDNQFETAAAAAPPIQAGWSIGVWSESLYIRDYDTDYTMTDAAFAIDLVLQSRDTASLEMPAFTVAIPDNITTHTSFEILVICVGHTTGDVVTGYAGDTAKLTFYDDSTGLYVTDQTDNVTLANGDPLDITDSGNWTNGACLLDIKIDTCDIDGYNLRAVMEIDTLGALQYFDTTAVTEDTGCVLPADCGSITDQSNLQIDGWSYTFLTRTACTQAPAPTCAQNGNDSNDWTGAFAFQDTSVCYDARGGTSFTNINQLDVSAVWRNSARITFNGSLYTLTLICEILGGGSDTIWVGTKDYGANGSGVYTRTGGCATAPTSFSVSIV